MPQQVSSCRRSQLCLSCNCFPANLSVIVLFSVLLLRISPVVSGGGGGLVHHRHHQQHNNYHAQQQQQRDQRHSQSDRLETAASSTAEYGVPSSSSSTTYDNNGHIVTTTTYGGSSSVLKVLNLNAWGLSWPWSKDRTYRFRALREIIASSDYDIILLQEVWFRQDYDIIRASVPYVTFFESFNKGCSGYFLPIECSGLMILSRHPIETVEFRPFSYRGSFWNFDGEVFVSKGVGRARIHWMGLKVDVFTSHFVSYTRDPNSDNSHYRFTQAMETVRYIEQSSADIKLFGGDINALPLFGPRQPYGILRSILNDSLTDMYPDASYHPWFATFGNLQNSYTRGALPERIDYLMYSSRPGLHMTTSKFVMPMFITRNRKSKLVSLSDHEALHVEFRVDVEEYMRFRKRTLGGLVSTHYSDTVDQQQNEIVDYQQNNEEEELALLSPNYSSLYFSEDEEEEEAASKNDDDSSRYFSASHRRSKGGGGSNSGGEVVDLRGGFHPNSHHLQHSFINATQTITIHPDESTTTLIEDGVV